MKASIFTKHDSNVLAYACNDFKQLLYNCTNVEISDDAQWVFELKQDKSLEYDHAFKIEQKQDADKLHIVISGAADAAILRGMYTALEMAGFTFKMNKAFAPGGVDFSRLANVKKTVVPNSRFIGIRQHINFPMDISSYSLHDACDYIYALARMGFNSITFHSYTGQWHGYEGDNGRVYGGNFFYGQRHEVPSYTPAANAVANRKYYCIPEIEQQLFDEQARDEYAQYWLKEVIAAAKRCGMQVCYSIELPPEETQDTYVQICRNVLKAYPQIDILEWISPEGGGPGEAINDGAIAEYLCGLFGENALEGCCELPVKAPSALSGAAKSLKRASDLLSRTQEIFDGMTEKQVAIGLYVMCPDTLKILKTIMENIIPQNILFTFLSAHGSLTVAENISYMGLSAQMSARTMVYSWLEFDGNMYLLQNGCDGINGLIQGLLKSSQGKPVYGICFNHWRTAENEIAASFAAHKNIATVNPRQFYSDYARKNGIECDDSFAKAMCKLAALDVFNRDKLFNIGFCYLGCWIGNGKGISWLRGWNVQSMQQSARMYGEICELLKKCIDATTSIFGISELRLLINRVQCSISHLQCMECLMPITEFADDNAPEKLSEAQKKRVLICCDKAEVKCREYIDNHIMSMPDRGCEGTVVSYFATIPVYIDHIRQYFAYLEKECTHLPLSFDAPPPPNTEYLTD